MNKQTHESNSPPASGKPAGLQRLLNGVVLVPAVVIPVVAVAVLGTLGFLGLRIAHNGGLMPRPTQLDTYACKGFAAPFQMAFRHGMDVVQLRVGNSTLYGDILNNRITWEDPAKAQAALGFVPPNDIVFDDTHLLRLLDASQRPATERVCERLTL
ncbi:hypothetical protein [Candidatus Aalborgicola defluviihabitans]|jgi:nitrate reductase NapE component|uniref:hypothetical protein n=1 Tax=Candidatus Aalborgicola defluviihabitans TaxID=3386187 RepID=UPI001DF36F69|nr:hypothetical protein [Burkholderiales bacterium]MBK7280212.1 hypothetical protein [Burkholderiales bacterium]MBK7314487.1 hypothetical protein [Burkholderiales bacterium]MBL0244211.1 hypothetical protein [Rhodoferax sp.]